MPKRSSQFSSRTGFSKRRVPSASRPTPMSRAASVPSSTVSQIPQNTSYDEDADESLDHIVMAIDKTNKDTTGCAYYIAREELLCCVEPVENGGAEAIETLMTDIQPTVVLMSPRVDQANLGSTHPQTHQQGSLISTDDDTRPLPYELILRPGSDFKYENAIAKISTMQIPGAGDMFIRFMVPGENVDYNEAQDVDETGLTDQTGRLLHASGNLDVDNRLSVGCVGAVMNHLQRRRALEYLQYDPNANLAYRISRMETVSMKNTMLVNTDTLASLQIIQPEFHPNTAKQGPGSSGAKESLSVYGLFHHLARTPQGKIRLRSILLKPSLDLDEINDRLDFVAVGTSANNQSVCDRLSKSLGRIKNMRSTVTNLHKGIEGGHRPNGNIKSGVWAAILEFCFHTIDISDTLKEVERGGDLSLCVRVGETFDKTRLRRLGKAIHDVIDLDESVEQRRTVIKRDVDQNLDSVRDVYDGMETSLGLIARDVPNSMPPGVELELNVIFLPQLGFHIVIPLNDRPQQPICDNGDVQWEQIFTTESHIYFKNTKMREMDEEFGDLYAAICDREIEISHSLAQAVLQDEDLLIAASDLCGELDALLALVHGAIQYKLVRPTMVEANVVNIQGGRHILQEMTVHSFVPNNAVIAGGCTEAPNMILLTGPNFSGKSVYLKQVALICYMAQVGSFVPATCATIGITDKILTRITTRETVSKVQSAFMIDLQQVTRALKSCTPRSLVIIDEFGKGTDSSDGAGLAAAVFEHLVSLKEGCPKVLASTHFHEIFESGRFDHYPNLAFAHMEVHVDHSKQNAEGWSSDVAYLYNLREGRSTLSYGNQCAAMNGVPTGIVKRATQLAELILQGADLVAACARLPETELEELQSAEMMARRFLALNFEQSSTATDIKAMLLGLFEGNVQ